ncbi:hypothetical protein SprV_0100410100 [Sparganum proliferum]
MARPVKKYDFEHPKGSAIAIELYVTYLDSTLSRNTKIDDEVARWISKAGKTFGRLKKHRVESSRSPPKHQTDDVKSGHPAHAAVWSRDLVGVQEAGAKSRPLPPQLSSTDIEAEVAGPNPGHGGAGGDGSLQHLCHTETSTTAPEEPFGAHGRRAIAQTTLLWRFIHRFPPTRSSRALQGYAEDFPEAPAYRNRQLGRPHPRPTDQPSGEQ